MHLDNTSVLKLGVVTGAFAETALEMKLKIMILSGKTHVYIDFNHAFTMLSFQPANPFPVQLHFSFPQAMWLDIKQSQNAVSSVPE
jgi:hypothetical protein